MKSNSIRQNIIETASSLFYKNGYNLTGINEIIAEAGIAKATLYNHFKSKEDVCLAYLKFKNHTFLNDIKKFCAAKTQGKAQILALFEFLEFFFKDRDFNGCCCIKTISEIPKENQNIRTEIQQQKKVFIKFISDLLIENYPDMPRIETESLTQYIYLLYESAVSESHLHQNIWPITSAKQLCDKITA